MSKSSPAVALPVFAQYYALTKPRVIQLIVFCALIGMVLAVPGLPSWRELGVAAVACLGIWLVAGAAAAFNCIIEKSIDAKMKRTAWRPTAKGELKDWQTLLFSATLCALGSVLLYFVVNPLTMWLTFATFIGYAVIYTVILKPLTPQNIVIGGASGAMPPVLGWAAMTGDVGPEALILFLIIFLWTPPHFWPLAIARQDKYQKIYEDFRIPMLPVTNGVEHTLLQILLYSVLLLIVTLLPYLTGMSGLIYLATVIPLGLGFIYYAVLMMRLKDKATAMTTFWYSIVYITLLFAALLIDHYFRFTL